MILDATNLILGRMATAVAKKALLGEKIDIVNCENAVISGNKYQILERYKHRRERGIPAKGPFFPRTPERLVKRTIRGMLPYKQSKGDLAFKRIRCHIGIPEEMKNEKLQKVEKAKVEKLPNYNYITVKEVCESLK